MTTFTNETISSCPTPPSWALPPYDSDLYQTGMERGGGSSVLLEWTYEYNCVSGLRESETDPNGLEVIS